MGIRKPRLLKLCSDQVSQLRGLTHTVNGQGASVRPKRPCRGGGGFPSGSRNLKVWSKQVTIRNSSIFASCSPMHTLRPGGHMGQLISSCYKQLIFIHRSMFQLCNMSNERHTNPKWHKAIFPKQGSIIIQETCRVEIVWLVPHTGVSMDRPQVGQNNCSFGDSVASELYKRQNTSPH